MTYIWVRFSDPPMASYLQIENISKSYGVKVLFDRIGFNVNEGDKVALIAPNGAGKTSLLRILSGKDSSDSGGKILFLKDIRIAFLEQDYSFDPEKNLFNQIWETSGEWTEGLDWEHQEAYRRRIRELLTRLGLGDGSRLMGDLSGGEVKRVAIVRVLASEADFYLLDEPTNHLDIDAIEFLEGYLKHSRCTLFMVTHDRYFLDRVCNTVMELDRGQLFIYRGNYQNFLEKRQERIDHYNAETEKVRNLFRRELEWIHASPCARTGKAKYRKQAFKGIAERAADAYRVERVDLSETVQKSTYLGNKVINCRDLHFWWGGKCYLRDFTYNFQRYERVGIVGPNAAGKTTFLNLLTGGWNPSLGGEMTGTIDRGESLRIGYYNQSGMHFKPGQTVLETVNDTRLLGRFLFPHDMLTTRVERLSGGERRRLYLLTILMQEPNLLILDEPTNDLDIMTLDILEEYLLEFKGTLIIVSHDRHFLDRLVDHLLVFCGDGVIKDFIGNYTEYRTFLKDREAEQRTAIAGKGAVSPERALPSQAMGPSRLATGGISSETAPFPAKRRRLSFKEQQELKALEAHLPELEAEKAALEAALSSGTLSPAALQEQSTRYAALAGELDTAELRYLELLEIQEK